MLSNIDLELKMFQNNQSAIKKMINLEQVKQKFVHFISFIFFYEINTKLLVDSCCFSSSENLPNKKKNDAAQKKIKKSHIANMPQSYSQF